MVHLRSLKVGMLLTGLCAGFLSFTAVYAQTATGTIRGTVSDPSEATVPDCTVSVRERQTNSIRTATSDTKGSFQLPLLPAGTYELTVQKQGFATYKRLELHLDVNQTLDLPVQLAVGAESQVVNVTSQVPLLETTSSPPEDR